MKKTAKNTTAQGLFWRSLEGIGTQVMNFFIQLVLARILFPEDFGIVATLNIFINLANTFVNNGISMALLRKKDAKDVDFCTVFYIEVGIAVVLYAVLFFCAPLVSNFYNNDALTLYLRVFALTLIFGAFSSFQTTVLRYRMDFRSSFFANFFGFAVQGILGITFALLGFGVWSLILSQLAYRVVSLLLLSIFAHWLPKPKFSFRSFKELFSYSWKMFVGWMVGTLYADAFSMIIGKAYDSTTLGYYTKGQAFPSVVNKTVTQVTSAVMFPAIAKVQDDITKVKYQTRTMISVSSALVFPVMAGIAAVAEALVLVVLEEKWAPAIPIIQLLSIPMAINVVSNANMQSFNAIGRSDVFLIIEIIKRVITVGLVLIAAQINFYLLLGTIGFMGVVSLIINAFYNKKLINYTLKEQLIDIVPYVLYALGLFAVVYPMRYLPLPEVVKLILQIGTCALIYVPSILLIKKGAFLGIKKTLLSFLKRGKGKDVVKEEKQKEVKKILLLGGSAQQVVAIEKAKELGYYTVLCDYLSDNPGQYVADKFYLVSTTDKEAVLEVAKEERVDGVLAYASDPAAPTAAYVAEQLSLPTNPYESVRILSEKHLFRGYLKEQGFETPKSVSFSYGEYSKTKEEQISQLHFPVLVKPVDSSGSKGITRIEDIAQMQEALEYAQSFSRNKIIEVEEYIEKAHDYLVGGDIFVVDGKVVFWGLLNCHRDGRVNPLVPVGKSYPLKIEKDYISLIKKELQRLISSLDIRFGAFNVELIISQEGKLYFIELGPRNGGNMIPDLLSYISGKDMIKASVECAMGKKNTDISFEESAVFYATHNLHSEKDGKFSEIVFDESMEKYIIRKEIYKKKGDDVFYFDGANKALGIIFMKFDSMDEMIETLRNIEEYIAIKLE